MRMRREAGEAVAVMLVALALAGCAAQSPGPQLAQLTAHVKPDTIIAPTVGQGDRTLPSVALRSGSHVGVEASCASTVSGSVTVTLPSGVELTADCATGGRQAATADYATVPGRSGAVTVTTSSPQIRWNATAYYLSQ